MDGHERWPSMPPAEAWKEDMSVRSHPDPAVYLALPVWLCAAIVFPLQIGTGGAPAASLLFYLLVAGALLSVADALHDTASYGNWQVAVFEWLLRVLGLAVPALLAYSLGALAAPDEPAFEPSFCSPGSYAVERPEAGIDLPGDDDCLVAGATLRPMSSPRG
jgi:hypothetical protein